MRTSSLRQMAFCTATLALPTGLTCGMVWMIRRHGRATAMSYRAATVTTETGVTMTMTEMAEMIVEGVATSGSSPIATTSSEVD